jgi:hypothetical protein
MNEVFIKEMVRSLFRFLNFFYSGMMNVSVLRSGFQLKSYAKGVLPPGNPKRTDSKIS